MQCHSPRRLKWSLKALIWKQFVYLNTTLTCGYVTTQNCSEICAVQGFCHRGRPLCSFICQYSMRVCSVLQVFIFIGLRCCQSSANSALNSLLRLQEKTKQTHLDSMIVLKEICVKLILFINVMPVGPDSPHTYWSIYQA